MRRFVLVLAFAALVLPSVVSAQQPERDSVSSAADDAPKADVATMDPRTANAPRSLMGMVMAVLIESAEQQSAAKRELAKKQSDRATDTKLQPDAVGPPIQSSRAREQVAVQSEP